MHQLSNKLDFDRNWAYIAAEGEEINLAMQQRRVRTDVELIAGLLLAVFRSRLAAVDLKSLSR